MSCKTLQEGKPGLYRNDLLAANTDTLEAPSITQSWSNRSEIDIEWTGIVNVTGSNQMLIVLGLFNSPLSGLIQIYARTDNSLQMYVSGINDTAVETPVLGSINYGEEFTLKVKNLDILINDVVVYTMAEDTNSTFDSNSPIVVGKNTGNFWYLDGYVKNFSIGTDVFPLNEARGDKFYSEDFNGQYKNTLVSTNQDYLELNNDFTWVNLSDIDFEINLSDVQYIPNQAIFGAGITNNASTGIVRLSTSATGFALLISDVSGTNQISRGFNTSGTDKKVSLKNLELKIDDVVIETFTDQTVNIDSSTFPATVGKLSYATLWFLDGEVGSFSVNGETFLLNETEGITFTGTQGTTGTRNTSHAGGLSYINDSMITPDGWSKGLRITSHAGGLEYIEDTMIQRYGVERGDRKNVLIEGNSDNLHFNSPITLLPDSSIRFEGSVSDLNAASYSTLLGFSDDSYLAILSDGSTSQVRIRHEGTNTNKLGFIGLSPNEVFTLDFSRDAIDNYYVSINEDTPILIKFYSAEFELEDVGFRTGSIEYSSIELYSLKVNEEVYNLNEHNGATFYGDQGSTGQRITSHAGGINYINHDIITTYINDIVLKEDYTPSADENFYASIYDADIIGNLTINEGVALTLTKDIFISGEFVNNGTVVGGIVIPVPKNEVINNMAYSWESDLGISSVPSETVIATSLASLEYLKLASNRTLQIGQTAEITFTVTSLPNDTNYLIDGFASVDRLSVSMVDNNGSRFNVWWGTGSGYSFKLNGEDVLVQDATNFVFGDGSTIENHLNETIVLEITRNGGDLRGIGTIGADRVNAFVSNILIHNFRIHDETFDCNEGTGTTTTGSLGTIGTLSSASMWADISGVQSWVDNINGYTFNPNSPAERPEYHTTDATFKGLPSIETVNTKISQLLTDGSITVNSGVSQSIYFVMEDLEVLTGTRYALQIGVDATLNGTRIYKGAPTVFNAQSFNAGAQSTTTLNNTGVKKAIYRVDIDSSRPSEKLRFTINNLQPGFVQGTDTLTTLPSTSGPLSIGNTGTFHSLSGMIQAKWAFVGGYLSESSESQKNMMQSYLNRKYLGLPFGIQCAVANQSRIEFDSLIIANAIDPIIINLNVTTLANTIHVLGDGTALNRITISPSGNVTVRINSILESTTDTPIGLGLNEIKLLFDGVKNTLTINGVDYVMNTIVDPMPMDRIGEREGSYSDVDVYDLSINGEVFDFNEGYGEKTTGSNGTVATLVSNDNPEGMWVIDNN